MGRFLRFVFLVLNGGILALFCMGYAAAYLHPAYFWWGGLVAVALPYLSLLLLCTSVVVLLQRRRWRRLFALHLCFLLLIGVRFIQPQRWLDAKPISDQDLVLMTMNVPRIPETDLAEQAVLNLVSHYEPHLIGIQESTVFALRRTPNVLRMQKKFRRLVDSLNYRSLIPRNNPASPRYTEWRQPVIARIPIAQQQQVVLPGSPRGTFAWWALRSELQWQGQKIVHYNLHLHTHGIDKPWDSDKVRLLEPASWMPYVETAREAYRKRAWEAEQIRNMIAQEAGPVIVSGDFNSTPHNWAYRHLARGFQDAFAVAGAGWGATYHVGWPLVRIDFVLLSAEWEVVSAEVPKSNPDVSDHLPLVARLRLR